MRSTTHARAGIVLTLLAVSACGENNAWDSGAIESGADVRIDAISDALDAHADAASDARDSSFDADASTLDGSRDALDAPSDSHSDAVDARADVPDVTRVDAVEVITPRDVAIDVGSPDVSTDAGTPTSCLDVTTTCMRRECVPAVAGNELNPGMLVNSNLWAGWRFEVTPGASVHVSRIGLNIVPDFGSAGTTLFGAIVALTSSSDTPDMPDLSGSDVLTTTLVTMGPASVSSDASANVSVTLAPGWYAVMFGAGRFGATATSAILHSNSGAGGCTNMQFPFTLRQSDGMFILQAATPNLYVETD